MTYAMPRGLPDPDYDHAFYDGVPAKRFFAWVLDVVMIAVIAFVIGLLTLTALLWIWPILYLTISFLYRSLTISSGSATLGMRLMNIELRNGSGSRLTGGEAAIHTILYLCLSASMILQVISIGMMVISGRHQGLHDMVLGTAAINSPR